MPLSRPDEVAGSQKQPVEESGIAALKITDLAPLSTTIFSTFSDLWASFSRNQALGKAPVAPQMADLASQDILRAPCGGVGEGWERIFNDFWDPKKAHVQHFFVKNTHLLRDLFFSDVSRRNRAAPKGGQPLQSAVYSSKNQLFRFWLRT